MAVLGILAINLAGFAGPIAATLSPHVPDPGTWADEAWYAAMLVLFEGKMRTLFTLMFGASLLLYVDQAEARGDDGERLQLRRLGWLAVFGYLHHLLFWWGDILFTYALAGSAALALRQARPGLLAALGGMLFVTWHLGMTAAGWPAVVQEQQVLSGQAPAAMVEAYRADRAAAALATAQELARDRQGFAAQIAYRLREAPAEPLEGALATLGESLPLMLIGMALFRSGLFSGEWPPRRLRRITLAGLGLGGGVTLAFAAGAWDRHFPPVLMIQALAWQLAVPHLLMGLAYATLLVRATPWLATTRLGQRLIATGRMALSNYLGTTLVMTGLFYGWGLGLVGQVPERWLWPFLLGGWALMLGWSKPWLARFRYGPLEWLWRSLTLGRLEPLRRA